MLGQKKENVTFIDNYKQSSSVLPWTQGHHNLITTVEDWIVTLLLLLLLLQ